LSKPTSPSREDKHDFTRPGATAPPRPTPEQVERARQEAERGIPHLRDSGFFVSIARHAAARVPPKNGSKYVILAVEDDADLGQLLIDIFMIAGYEVRWASNRAEINAQLRRGNEIDVVLMDVVLPDADGLEILQRLRAHPRFGTIPVIMMTVKSAAQDVSAGLAAGADGYVTKPFHMSGLVKAVSLVLGV
jgi:two-component system OmpR family response regulator